MRSRWENGWAIIPAILLCAQFVLWLSNAKESYENCSQQSIDDGIDIIMKSAKRGPICGCHLLRVFQELLKGAGLPKIRFHDLRHTSASLMLNKGIASIVVSRRFGHSTASTTLDLCGHLLPFMQAEAAELIDELMTPITSRSIAPELHPDQ